MRFNNFWLEVCLIGFIAVISLNLKAIYASSERNQNENRTVHQQPRYYHNIQRREPNRTVTSGAVRGQCPGNNKRIFLQILAPDDHLGLTAQTHPTFFWYLNLEENQSRTIKFTLVEVGRTEPIFEQIFIADGSPSLKLMQFTLPDTVEPLKINQTYRWTVTVVCNLQRPSSNYFSSTMFKVISKRNQSFNYSLETNAILSARQGIWYDSLYYAYSSGNSQLFAQLLKEVNIFLFTE
ncbi:MAG: DUF928 domain-containing protein [Gloeocapsa sp. DLM2.Bin57]|nr:MAG: DUF928 domain-containing protein [Gloeocapsa sp. DLM2.Bin57]